MCSRSCVTDLMYIAHDCVHILVFICLLTNYHISVLTCFCALSRIILADRSLGFSCSFLTAVSLSDTIAPMSTIYKHKCTDGVLSIILDVLIVPKYGILFYHWSVYHTEILVQGHLNETAPRQASNNKTR